MPTFDEYWIVYTNDTRFPTTQIHEVYLIEDVAKARADQLNAEDRANGVSDRVRFSHATRFLLRSELPVEN